MKIGEKSFKRIKYSLRDFLRAKRVSFLEMLDLRCNDRPSDRPKMFDMAQASSHFES
jgi:hypothetical protein